MSHQNFHCLGKKAQLTSHHARVLFLAIEGRKPSTRSEIISRYMYLWFTYLNVQPLISFTLDAVKPVYVKTGLPCSHAWHVLLKDIALAPCLYIVQ